MPTVIYCDGGAKDGYAGWGVYIKTEEGEEIDACGGVGPGTNNTAELQAFVEAMEWVVKEKKDKVLFILDSKYVIDGVKFRLNNWVRNNWVKSDGKIVANLGFWKKIHSLLETAKKEELRWRIEWVKGHSGDKGNDRADGLATRGITHATSALSDYWSTDVNPELEATIKKFKRVVIHPLLTTSHAVFVTGMKTQEMQAASKFGYKAMYMLANYEDSDKLRGSYLAKPSSDAIFGVAFLTKEEDLLETIRVKQEEFADEYYNVPSQFLLTPIYSKRVQEEMHVQGTDCLSNTSGCVSLWGSTLLTRYMAPSLRASFGLKKLEELQALYAMYREGDSDILIKDITDTLFSEAAKGFVVNPDITDKKPIRMELDIGGVQVKHILTHGIDVPTRNNLGRIAKASVKPKAEILLYSVNDFSYRFALVINTGEETAIYAPSESDHRFLLSQTKKKGKK